MELILDQAQLCLVGLYMVCLISFSSLFGSFFLYSMKRINILEITQMHLNITIIDNNYYHRHNTCSRRKQWLDSTDLNKKSELVLFYEV